MNYIVMDLEFNQPFDFSKNTKKKANPEIPFEIIQIGCVKLDENYKKIDSLNIFIKPIVYKRLHPFVAKITGINKSDLNDGSSFVSAYNTLANFVSKEDSIFCVWGDVDLKLLFKNISYYKLDNSFMPRKFINVQKIASRALSWSSGNQIGLKNAIELLEIEIKRPFHDAYHDAEYTGLIVEKLKVSAEDINEYSINGDKNKSKPDKKISKNTNDFAQLYNYIEKELGRKLTQKEKKLYKNIYILGTMKKFKS